jgi:biotin operon repressor
MFRDINKEQTIEKAMQNLKQKGVAIAYATKF